MDEQTLAAVKAELTKIAAGMMDAMALLAVLIYASGNITKNELIELSGKVAAGLRHKGENYSALLLEGMIKRLESFEGDIAKRDTSH